MSAFGGKADAALSTQQLRQLGDVRGDPALFRPAFDTLKHEEDLQRHGNVDGIGAARGLSQLLRNVLPCGLRACRGWQMTH
jgi:hypothetical protein